ncbi:13092_t:CDS:2, partial [Gigaspora rosea]
SLDYISDDNNIFADDYDGDKTNSNNEEDHLQILKVLSNAPLEHLIPAKRKKVSKVSTKPKSSYVWKFFSQPIDGKVYCQIANCDAILVEELKKGLVVSGQLTLDQTLDIVRPYSKPQALKLYNNLLSFVINTVQPLTIVEEEDFIKYSYNLDPKYKIPCKKVLKDKIDEAYYNSIIEFQEKINETSYVNMTLDLWSSAVHIPYLGLREAQNYLISQQENSSNILNDDEEFIILNVVKANNTRWNSFYYAFERLIILKSAIIMLKETLLQDVSTRAKQEGEFLVSVRNTLSNNSTNFTTYEVIEMQEIINEDLASCWNYPNYIGIYASFFDPRFKDLKSKIQTIEEIKEEYKNISENTIIVFHQASSSTSAIANIFATRNQKIPTPIYDEFTQYLNEN